MRGSDTNIDLAGVGVTLLIALVVTAVGMQAFTIANVGITPVEQTEHYDRSQAWCEAEGGEMYVANDATNTDHNGLHCETGSETYHMWAVQDLNYTHDDAALAEKCGATNVPLLIGCRGGGVLLTTAVLGAVILGIAALTRYYRGGTGIEDGT